MTTTSEQIQVTVKLPYYCAKCHHASEFESNQFVIYRNNSPKGSRLAIVMTEINKMCAQCKGWMKIVQ